MTKPVFLLSVHVAPDGDNFIADATARLEAAGYVVVLTSAPDNSILTAPADARTQVAATVLGAQVARHGFTDPMASRWAVESADQLLKELAK